MWQNWSGHVVCPNAAVSAPGSHQELAALLRHADRNNTKVRAVGAGHSFSPLVQTDDTIVSLDRLQGIIQIDHDRGTARVHAGTRLFELGPALAAQGVAMENLGDINMQSVAGATSTGTHGTGVNLGNLATQISSLTFLRADGTEVVADSQGAPDLFEGGRVALGALGIITEITLRVVPLFTLELQRARMSLEDCLGQANSLVQRHRSFEFYWLPHTDSVLTKAWNVTDQNATPKDWKRRITEDVLENMFFGSLCELSRRIPALAPLASRTCASMIGAGTHVDASHSVLSAPRRVFFNETEWAIPAEHGAEALLEIREFISKKFFPLMFPLEYRWVRADNIWLSPNFQRDSVHISAHQYRGMPHERYFDGVQAICLRYGGRPHWGKMHSLRGKDFAKLYPRWDDFLGLREHMDPQGRFLTPYLESLFGLDRSSVRLQHLRESYT